MKRPLWTIAATIIVSMLAASIPAKANDDLGPPTGVAAPSIGKPMDHTGAARDLQSLMGTKGLVLFFFRSADWCPVCQAQLIALNGGNSGIEDRGYKLVGISYDTPQTLAAFVERRNIQFTFLSDPKSEIIDRFELRDPQYPPGNRAHGVPRPIIFVLDRQDVILSKLYEQTFRTRPPIGLVLSTLDRLAAE